jgi:hypothetical protein
MNFSVIYLFFCWSKDIVVRLKIKVIDAYIAIADSEQGIIRG